MIGSQRVTITTNLLSSFNNLWSRKNKSYLTLWNRKLEAQRGHTADQDSNLVLSNCQWFLHCCPTGDKGTGRKCLLIGLYASISEHFPLRLSCGPKSPLKLRPYRGPNGKKNQSRRKTWVSQEPSAEEDSEKHHNNNGQQLLGRQKIKAPESLKYPVVGFFCHLIIFAPQAYMHRVRSHMSREAEFFSW